MKNRFINILFLLAGLAPMAHANLVSNGDFEAGGYSGGATGGFGPFLTFNEGSTGIPGWIVGPGGVNLWTDYNGTGNHVIDIIGNSTTAGGSLAQTFSTANGQPYRVAFNLAGGQNPTPSDTNSPVKTMDVNILGADGVAQLVTMQYIQDTTIEGWAGGIFHPYEFQFTADGVQATIEFIGTNKGWNGFYIDNVTITAVPLPAAAWLFGAGLLALAGVSGIRPFQ